MVVGGFEITCAWSCAVLEMEKPELLVGKVHETRLHFTMPLLAARLSAVRLELQN